MAVDFIKILDDKDSDIVFSSLNMLTPTEKSIIHILSSKGRACALNVKQIQSEFTLSLIKGTQHLDPNAGNTKSDYGEDDDGKYHNIRVLPYYFDLTAEDLQKISEITIKDNREHNDFYIRQKGKKVSDSIGKIDSSQKSIKGFQKELMALGISYPSFEKINLDLITLEKMSLVVKREVDDKKTIGLWSINPKLDYHLNRSKKSLTKLVQCRDWSMDGL